MVDVLNDQPPATSPAPAPTPAPAPAPAAPTEPPVRRLVREVPDAAPVEAQPAAAAPAPPEPAPAVSDTAPAAAAAPAAPPAAPQPAQPAGEPSPTDKALQQMQQDMSVLMRELQEIKTAAAANPGGQPTLQQTVKIDEIQQQADGIKQILADGYEADLENMPKQVAQAVLATRQLLETKIDQLGTQVKTLTDQLQAERQTSAASANQQAFQQLQAEVARTAPTANLSQVWKDAVAQAKTEGYDQLGVSAQKFRAQQIFDAQVDALRKTPEPAPAPSPAPSPAPNTPVAQPKPANPTAPAAPVAKPPAPAAPTQIRPQIGGNPAPATAQTVDDVYSKHSLVKR